VHRILTSTRLNRLAHVDRATGESIRRYEHPDPGSLVHVDVKKGGNIPGRRLPLRRTATGPEEPCRDAGQTETRRMTRDWSYAFVHTVIDDQPGRDARVRRTSWVKDRETGRFGDRRKKSTPTWS
jgi:hypothetical protein